MASDNSLRLAVLIDADNASPTLAEPLLAEVAKYGTAHVKRAYGDWTSTNLTGWKAHLLTLSIQPVQQFAYTSGHNATDSALIIDAMDLLYTGRFDGFCLVSSDSDFTRLAGRLRESGLTVFGIGERKTPRAFVAACDKFVYAENLSSAQRSASDTALDGATQIPGPDLIGLVTAAVEASSDEDGWAHLGAVGNYLSKSRPDFDTRTYGYPKLKPLVQSLGAFDIDQRRPGEGKPVAAFVRCRDRARSDTAPPEKTLSRDSAPLHQVTVIDPAGERVRLRIPLEHRYRDTLLRSIYTAWRDGEIGTIGALEAVIERNAPEMEKPTRTIAINSLIYEDNYALVVRDSDSSPRSNRCIQSFDGQPEDRWVSNSHIAWLAFLIYRLPAGSDPADHLLDALFDDPGTGRKLLAKAQTVAHRRRTQTTDPQDLLADDTVPPAAALVTERGCNGLP
ncbi:NYN domain-containing protein [Nocardia carnea]|uniref:NYN domain-containing protein n=1 Tax=Nocardia carnea TaxID=37328 RepID=UPI002458D361|nr:NYN domain-containing protein [Nocardia carnea]